MNACIKVCKLWPSPKSSPPTFTFPSLSNAGRPPSCTPLSGSLIKACSHRRGVNSSNATATIAPEGRATRASGRPSLEFKTTSFYGKFQDALVSFLTPSCATSAFFNGKQDQILTLRDLRRAQTGIQFRVPSWRRARTVRPWQLCSHVLHSTPAPCIALEGREDLRSWPCEPEWQGNSPPS